MLFKLTYSLKVHVQRDEDLPVTVELDEANTLTLRIRETKSQSGLIRQVCADLVADRRPPRRVSSTLRALRENRLLLDDPPQEGLPYTSLRGPIVDVEGRITERWKIPFGLLPKASRPWLSELNLSVADLLKRYIKTLRWRQAASGGHQPFSVVGFEWSDDGEVWSYVPTAYKVTSSTVRPFDVRRSALVMAADLLAAKESEPFAHELIREAAEVAHSAPRSGLLIAFSALETGLKAHLSFLLPGGDSLVEKLPSPPVTTLLRDVIPAIHEARSIQASHIPLPHSAAELLQKWLTQRNQVAHGAKRAIDGESLGEFIDLVSDILYVLDVSRGQTWALENLRTNHWPS